MMEKILVLGASGLVGRALCNELKYCYKVYGTYNKNDASISKVEMVKFDIENSDMILEILYNIKPNKVIVSLRGSYDKQLNVIKHIIEYSKKNNSNVLFISTWNVFDACPNKVYYENDELFSDTDYGMFKIEVERLLTDTIGDRCIVCRLPMIWGKDSLRLNKLRSSLNNNEAIEVVTNLFLNNNADELLARQISYISQNYFRGVFHLGSVDMINHYDFIKSIVSKLGYENVEYKEIQYEVPYLDGKYIATLASNIKLPEEIQVYNKDIVDNLVK